GRGPAAKAGRIQAVQGSGQTAGGAGGGPGAAGAAAASAAARRGALRPGAAARLSRAAPDEDVSGGLGPPVAGTGEAAGLTESGSAGRDGARAPRAAASARCRDLSVVVLPPCHPLGVDRHVPGGAGAGAPRQRASTARRAVRRAVLGARRGV